ncbi:hypothetical protein VTJ83DRAFT_6179 [Remersonia thermophila]|uniref:Uncharacterized protein n=1 Tax=Remersonia thermophila TaxID=72144 RepID=A0ABR4D8Y0_9PEZI
MMKITTFLASGLGLFASISFAMPLEERAGEPFQTVHLTFHAGPVSYNLTLPADGHYRQTNNDLSVNIIEAPDYNAFYQCQFETLNEATLASGISPTGSNLIFVGPPTPIKKVRCQGMCVPTWGECYRSGQYVGPCCTGFCAANRCRPWVYTTV